MYLRCFIVRKAGEPGGQPGVVFSMAEETVTLTMTNILFHIIKINLPLTSEEKSLPRPQRSEVLQLLSAAIPDFKGYSVYISTWNDFCPRFCTRMLKVRLAHVLTVNPYTYGLCLLNYTKVHLK
ncbi:unnamed protein product [Amoebophrya sp. A120]|nr:unnamed protein product [Amoebophrya sp. A120]|eukprot:GSA120T00010399001.1